MILWDGEPPKNDNNDGALGFAVFALVFATVVIVGQLIRAGWIG